MKHLLWLAIWIWIFNGQYIAHASSAQLSRDSRENRPVVDLLLEPTTDPRLASRSGYYQIEPISYSFQDTTHGTLDITTATHRIFYTFHPAKNDPSFRKPLFVMLNGGPGAGTSVNLFSMNTAPFTLDPQRQPYGSPGYSTNPWSWDELGDLLYIDAPQTGFSYMVHPGHDDVNKRMNLFLKSGNFNPFIDAAQILRVVLKFLRINPHIKANKVIFVGESYGGTRVTTMLNIMLFHPYYKDGSKVFTDTALVAEIEEHFRSIYGDGVTISPEKVAAQFGRQILIQPELSGVYQDEIQGKMYYQDGYVDPVMQNIAKETGHEGEFDAWYPTKCWALGGRRTSTCVLMYWLPYFDRDGYNCQKEASWSDDLEAFASMRLWNTDALSAVLSQDVRSIVGIHPDLRSAAFRFIFGSYLGYTLDDYWIFDNENKKYLPTNPKSLARLEAYRDSQEYIESQFLDDKNILYRRLGFLPNGYDYYFVAMNLAVFLSFMSDQAVEFPYNVNPDLSPIYGKMFLENLSVVNTFLTDAEHDLVIYSPAIPEALKRYNDIVEDVFYARGKEFLDTRRGSFRVDYVPNSLEHTATPDFVYLYFPYYEDSGHSVSSAEPQKLFTDVANWLACTNQQDCNSLP